MPDRVVATFLRIQESSSHTVAGDDADIVALLRACAKTKDLCSGSRIHAHLVRRGFSLDRSSYISDTLVCMYAKCGALTRAKFLLDTPPARNIFTWTAVIAGFTQNGQAQDALKCLLQMQHEGLSPNAVTYTCILKACASVHDLDKGEQIHDEIAKQGLLQNDIVLGTALMDMYAKCGALAQARQVLEELPSRDVVSWNAVIAGYAQQGLGQDALDCFEQMQHEGLLPNSVTFASVLKACGSIGAIERGGQIHDEIVRQGLMRGDVVLGNALVDMYSKCGALLKAQRVFEELPIQDMVSWNALMTGYVQQGQSHDALNCFEQMQCKGLSPDAVTFACILKACGNIGAAYKGEQIHGEIARQGLLGEDMVLGNALVDMYAQCGALAKARQVIEELPTRTVVSWTALIEGYAKNDQGEEALKCFELMQQEGLSLDSMTLASILKASGSLGIVDKGAQIHNEIVKWGLLEDNNVLRNALLDMYVKCGALKQARQVLEELPTRDVVSWTTLIEGYAEEGLAEEALSCFKHMQQEGVSPNTVTFACILKACSSIGAVDKGEQIHYEIARQGLLEKSTVLGNALVDMYAKCGALVRAQEVHKELPARDVVSWNTLIAGYVQQGRGEEALFCFEEMQREGLSPSVVTLTCILNACGSIGAVGEGEQIHDKIVRQGLLGQDIILANALMDMYAKCGALAKARQVLEELPTRDVVSWNVLIAGYAQQEQGQEAVMCFEQMQHEGLLPNAVTFTTVLKACGSVGAFKIGEQIHDEIARKGLLGNNIVLGNALVDMYAKCGALSKAQRVLEELPTQDVVSWNALIAGYAQQGQCKDALNCFEQMQEKGLTPNAFTFCYILNACTHSGLVAEGEFCFANMSTMYDTKPDLEHYTSMIDLFGRVGHLEKAVTLTQNMPSGDYFVMWHALLGACKKWQDVNVGRWAFEHVAGVHKTDAATDVLTPEPEFNLSFEDCSCMRAFASEAHIYDEIAS